MRDGKRVLCLEDNEERIEKFKSLYTNGTVVTTASDCIQKLLTGKYDVVTLDHDLGGEVYVDSNREDCGMEVVRWLEKLNVRGMFTKNIRVFIHSHNTPAANNMLLALQRAGYNVHRTPFGFTDFWNPNV